MPQTDTNQTGQGGQWAVTLPVPPVIPNGEEVYDMLMSKIEVELTTSQLPLLKEKYKDETPQQASERGLRYNKAFAEYDKQYAEYQRQQEGAVRSYEQGLKHAVESIDQEGESGTLQDITSAIASI